MTSQLPYRAKNDKAVGHLAALFTILVWGTTFVSTKILLVDFSPIEILFIRFAMGLVALFLIAPKLLRWMGWRHERLFLLAGLFGVTLYYLLENIALTGTLATNVGVIVSVAPFFTAALERLVNKGSRSRCSLLLVLSLLWWEFVLSVFRRQAFSLAFLVMCWRFAPLLCGPAIQFV